MAIFKSKKVSWWQVGVLKLALLFIGLAVGAQWSGALLPYVDMLAIVGLLAGLYSAIAWFRD
jgi:hypothetical protein